MSLVIARLLLHRILFPPMTFRFTHQSTTYDHETCQVCKFWMEHLAVTGFIPATFYKIGIRKKLLDSSLGM